ncbi:hypothetical protein [Flavobacterium psychrophilum]|uniref:hypothetical protein n=1 Tax=Flavobacterium psychrophilum TaxID=96345 RepID=UPI00106C4722|nr:hypothetical protein [Flavobacterium psychrophilum]
MNLINKIFEIQEKLLGTNWVESRKKAFSNITEMQNSQNLKTQNQVRKEAFEQVARIKSERLLENGKK